MTKYCSNCGNEIKEGANACSNCGTMVNADSKPAVVVNNVQSTQGKSNGLAIAGFIVSLVSTLLCCGSFNVISLILSIVGVVKAKDYDGSGKGMAIAGIIISSIGLLILILFTILGYAASIVETIENY